LIQKKLAQKLQEEALAEDSSVFQYDEVYDDIAAKREEAKQAKKSTEARAPKYITKLLETADKRKKEHERRVERQVQKEREAEGEEFKDKESFVTSSYRKKLEEMKEAEEVEKREAYLENIGDVTKQQDLSGFYRHIYEQKVTDESKESAELPDVKKGESSKTKNYRKRKSSADQKEESDKEDEKPTEASIKAHLISNLDADSDFEIESSDSEAEQKVEVKQEKVETEVAKENVEPNGKSDPEVKVKVEEEPAEPKEPPKPKIDIWKKRTVGEVFDQALERYYQRKAEREQAA
jgi:coiled-coil domain-containing protein 55